MTNVSNEDDEEVAPLFMRTVKRMLDTPNPNLPPKGSKQERHKPPLDLPPIPEGALSHIICKK